MGSNSAVPVGPAADQSPENADTKGDEFTSRILGSINSMLGEMMAAIASCNRSHSVSPP